MNRVRSHRSDDRVRDLAVGLFLASISLGGSLYGTTLIPMNVGQMADQAELIFVGTAVHQESRATGDASYAYTFVTFEVEQTFKGEVENQQLTLRFDGGDLDIESSLELVGMPRFLNGHEYLLFVADNGQAASPVVGWNQGLLAFGKHAKTGERVLFATDGAMISGIQDDSWQRSRRINSDQSAVTVISEDRVQGTAGPAIGRVDTAMKRAGSEAVTSNGVLSQLRTLVTSRAEGSKYRAEALVRSANPMAVPATRSFRAISTDGER